MRTRRPVNVGIVGLGRAGWLMHVPELRAHKGFRIAAACDVIEDRPKAAAREFGTRPYTDHKDLIGDPDVELVVVATRSDTHARVTVDALRAGKHVLVEKPMAVTLRQADRMIEAADRAGRHLLVRQNRRFDPDFLFIRDVMRSGLLGRVFYIRLCRHGYNRRCDWQTLTRFGGGQLNNWGPHIIDHALQFLGGRPVGLWSDLCRVAAAGDANDHVKVVMKGKTGLVVDLEISGGVAIGEPPYRVMGTLGTLTCDGQTATIRHLDPKKLSSVKANPGTPSWAEGWGNPEQLPWQEMTCPAKPRATPPAFYERVYRTLRLGRPFLITLDEARNVMWVIERARKGWRRA